MKKDIFSYFVGLAALVIIVVFLFWLFSLRMVSRKVDNGQSLDHASSDRIVLNSAAHYRVAVPLGWYVEKSGANGIILYPDYDPHVGIEPSCKIEISLLQNPSKLAFGAWLSAYLRQDPTVDIVEASQSLSRVSGRDAIVWDGILNGVSTTLTYVLGDGGIYEFAPSKILNGDCRDALQLTLKNFTITSQ
jgi:hypothetical protein